MILCAILSFQALIDTFYQEYTVCFDHSKKATSEEILRWFNVKLVGCGQKPWKKISRKWAIAQAKLRLSVQVWQRRDC